MKTRLIAVIVAALLVIALGTIEVVLSNQYLSVVYDEAKKLTAEIDESNYLETNNIERISELANYWQQKENILCFMVIHKDIEDLGKALAECKASQEVENYQDFKRSLDLALFLSDAYTHIFTLSAQNVF